VWNASREPRMLESMRIAMVVLVVLMLATPMRAQKSASDSIVRALADLDRRQCSGCTIDASGFR
jgi:hypothetical protein